MKAIEEMIKKLEKRHLQHIEVYGSECVHVSPHSPFFFSPLQRLSRA